MRLEHYRLDPANYLTSASLAWDSMLLKTKVELDLITDPEILTMIEKSKRGGLTFVGSKRYVKANNKYMGDAYDPKKESSYIAYVDANNLYGWAMSQFLPYDGIEFKNNISINEVLETPDEHPWGYVVECDLIFPKEIHNKLKQFPPAPEILTPNDEWMSDYQLDLKKKLNIKSK